jgi:hypothetical protein
VASGAANLKAGEVQNANFPLLPANDDGVAV